MLTILAILIGQATYPLDLRAEHLPLPHVFGLPELTAEPSHTTYYRLPGVYQRGGADWRIFGVDVLPDYNSNTSFPWAVTFGLDHAHKAGLVGDDDQARYRSINFRWLPTGSWIYVYRHNGRLEWIFPADTLFGEILYVRDRERQEWLPFEVRTRRKVLDQDQPGEFTWAPRLFRPIRYRAELCREIGDYREAKKYLYLRNNEETEVVRLEGLMRRLPLLSAETVRRLLKRPFVDVTGYEWSEGQDAPCADQQFSLFPKDYALGLITADAQQCSRCHRQTGISALKLTPGDPVLLARPDLVGSIRGSDGIFSWHPFRSFGTAWNDPAAKQEKFNRYELERGFVRFVPNGARQTWYVREALGE